MKKSWIGLLSGLVVFAGVAAIVQGQDVPPAASAPASTPTTVKAGLDDKDRALAKKLLDNAAKYLISQQAEDGSWSAGKESSKAPITAMVLKPLVQYSEYGPNHAAVKKGFDLLLKYKQKDGGIYEPKEGGTSYTSAVALMALASAKNQQYKEHITDLTAFLKGLQIVPGSESADGEKIKDDDPSVGGVTYGKGPGRPDLSNVGMWAEALHEAGVDPKDPAMKRAAEFITRLQNNSETNKAAWAKDGDNDGGFIYAMPGKDPGRGGGTRSYGSMTYTGFKTMLYAGVDRSDDRVKAAFRWIQGYWQLDSNPNMPGAQSTQGLFYYYHVFAKALNAWGQPIIVDAKKVPHNWRAELIQQLATLVKEDGSWVNKSDRWWEGSPVLATSFAMLALEEAVKPCGDEETATKPK